MWKIENGKCLCPKCGASVVITTAFNCVNAYCERCGWHSDNITDAQMHQLQEFAQAREEAEEAHCS